MARRGDSIRYRSNPPILGLIRSYPGRKVMDAVTGNWYPQYYQSVNDYGELVDQRGDGMDYYQDIPAVRGRG